MNILKTIAIGMFALATTAANASTFNQIVNASYELYRNGIPICSGQFVKPNEFLTAAHCLEDSNEYTYSIKSTKDNIVTDYKLTPLHIAPKYDTATLVLEDKAANFPVVDVAIMGQTPNLGDQILVGGYPDTQGYFFGVVGTYNGEVPMPPGFGMKDGKNQYVVSAWSIPGSSGSGVYRIIKGEWYLIGTMHGGPNDVMNFTSTIEGVHSVL